jgi:hypothetical protein
LTRAAFDAGQGPLAGAVLRLWARTWWVQLLLLAAVVLIQFAVLLPRLLTWNWAMLLIAETLYFSLMLRAVAPSGGTTWHRVAMRTAVAGVALALGAASVWLVMREAERLGLGRFGPPLATVLPYLVLAAVLALLGPFVARAAWPVAPGAGRSLAWRLAWFALAALAAMACELLSRWLLLAAIRGAGLPIAYDVLLIQAVIALGRYATVLPLAAAPVILARAMPPVPAGTDLPG